MNYPLPPPTISCCTFIPHRLLLSPMLILSLSPIRASYPALSLDYPDGCELGLNKMSNVCACWDGLRGPILLACRTISELLCCRPKERTSSPCFLPLMAPMIPTRHLATWMFVASCWRRRWKRTRLPSLSLEVKTTI